MHREGYGLLDLIVGIFLLGLMVVTVLPVLNNSYKNLDLIAEKTEMIYIAESTFENLLSSQENYSNIFFELQENDISSFDYLDEEYSSKFKCTIINEEKNNYLWQLKIIVSKINSEGNFNDIELKGSLPKQKGLYTN